MKPDGWHHINAAWLVGFEKCLLHHSTSLVWFHKKLRNQFVCYVVGVCFRDEFGFRPLTTPSFYFANHGKSLLSSHQTSQSETALLEVKWKHIVEQLLHSLTITSNFERFHGGVPKARALWCAIPCSTWVWISREKQIELQQPMKWRRISLSVV